MKNPVTLLSSILMLTLFTNCASSQFDKKPPFTVSEAKYQDWIGGQPGSEGTLVTINFSEQTDENIQFDSIYFNDKVIPIKVESINDKTTLTGNFIESNSKHKLIMMDKDPKKEFGNEAPKKNQKTPFELAKNECVIRYTINNKKLYFKLDSVQKGKTIIYP